jgi:putative spermidine/putrescine transport system permease protein
VTRGPFNGIRIALVIIAVLYMVAPAVVIVLASVNSAALIQVPPTSLSLRWYQDFFDRPEFVSALKTSLLVGAIAAVASTLIGVCCAFAISNSRGWVSATLESVFLAPLLIPSLIIGLALIRVFLTLGLSGTVTALVATHVILTLPLVIRMVLSSLAGMGSTLREAASSLGASPFQVLRRVTIPMIAAGVFGGALFAFIVSQGELNASLFVASSTTLTLPIQIFTSMQLESSPTVAAASTIQLLIAVVLVAVLDRVIGLRKVIQF